MHNILSRPEVVREIREELNEWKQRQALGELHAKQSYLADTEETHRSLVHKFITYVTQHAWFDRLIMLTIFVNALFIAVESSRSPENNGAVFEMADLVFLVIYTVEFVLKIYVEPIGYWRNNYNRFDFAVLALSYVEYMNLQIDLTFVQVLRALRALRALRSVSFIRALRVIVNALLKTLSSIANLLVLLLLIMYVFAIVGFYFFGPADTNAEPTDEERDWSTLGNALWTLWAFVTADGWTAFQDKLDSRGLKDSRIFTVCFIFIGHFVFTNLFIGIIIQNLDEAQSEEKLFQRVKRVSLVAAKKDILGQLQRQELMKGKRPSESRKQVESTTPVIRVSDLTRPLRETVRHDDIVPMTHSLCSLTWMRTYWTTLEMQENMMYRMQQLHFDMAHSMAQAFEERLRAAQT